VKLYVLIRNDLSKSQKTVQGIHAVAQILLSKKDVSWNNGHVICLRVTDELELKTYISKAKELKLDCDFFREPDIGNEITAVAILSSSGEIFKDLVLL